MSVHLIKGMKIRNTIFLIVCGSFVLGCGKSQSDVATLSSATFVPDVVVQKVSRSSIADYYQATGTVKARTTTNVSSNIMGRIVSFPVREGDTVARGQTIAEIDSRDAQTQIQKAQAALREAQASITEVDRSVDAAKAGVKTAESNKQIAEVTFGRYKQLFDRKSASAQEYDEARARLTAAASELERAKANVQTINSKRSQINARIDQARAEIENTKVVAGYARITAPVSGIVVRKYVEAGATASPGVQLLSIEDNSQYRLEVAVEESRSKLIQLGNRVSVRIDSLGQGDISGVVAEIMPSTDAASRSYTVKVDLPASPLLRSGLYGVARFPLAQKDAITVPLGAIVQHGQLTGVYIVNPEGIAQFRIFTTGRSAEGFAEVLSGLSEGDQIVASDVERVKDGVKVR